MTHRRIQVMIVEDDLETAKEIARCVGECREFNCLPPCSRADEAPVVAKRKQPDVIFFDLLYKKQERTDVISRLREVVPSSIILVLTIVEDSDLILRALQAGASGYLLKADGYHGLIRQLREALNEGAPLSKRIARRIIGHFHERGLEAREAGFQSLTKEERDILDAVAQGLSNRQIAEQRTVGVEVVKSRIESIFIKLRVRNRTQAAWMVGLRLGRARKD